VSPRPSAHIEAYRASGDGYQRAGEYALEAADAFTTPLLPGLTLALADVFRD